ncbi:peptidylprolyl isomerase [Eggerthellaceae bacterium zg-886]|uniref:Peptidyl-prolyl cis-trans isomerase n=2 Tax=Xiamenia xianingshaonis TaxID=2682776 RepID=A0ABX0IK52_9ACTN|nr:peptidylprolyl isomerase [Xiamenia xianingshaonis]
MRGRIAFSANRFFAKGRTNMQLGSTVTLTYKGTLDDGEVFGFATEENPMRFQTGMDMAIDGFEKAILEMNEVGERKTFTVDEHEAYGEYLEGHVAKIPVEQIPVGNIKVGRRIMLGSDEGVPAPATVIEVNNGMVTFDLNHPLAGKALTFEVELLEVEDAPEDFVSMAEKAAHMKEQSKLLGGDPGEDYR